MKKTRPTHLFSDFSTNSILFFFFLSKYSCVTVVFQFQLYTHLCIGGHFSISYFSSFILVIIIFCFAKFCIVRENKIEHKIGRYFVQSRREKKKYLFNDNALNAATLEEEKKNQSCQRENFLLMWKKEKEKNSSKAELNWMQMPHWNCKFRIFFLLFLNIIFNQIFVLFLLLIWRTIVVDMI